MKAENPDAHLNGYLNLQVNGSYKASELLTKYIIENEIKFEQPNDYVQIFYCVGPDFIYGDVVNGTQNGEFLYTMSIS